MTKSRERPPQRSHRASTPPQRAGARAALRDTEARLAAIVDAAVDTIVAVDEEERVLVFNRAAEHMFGRRADEVLGQSLAHLFPERHRAEHVAELAATSLASRATEGFFETSGLRASGEEFPLAASVAQVEAGGQKLFVVTLRDIRARQLADEERRRLERELHHAQKMEAIGTLAGGIAHDFNNLVMGILGNVEIARGVPDLAPEVAESLASIQEASGRARDLVRQLLAFRREEGARYEPVDLAAVVREELASRRGTIERQVRVETALGTRLPPVLGDASRLRQVVANLCTNALQAIGDRTGVLRLALRACDVGPSLPHVGVELPPGAYLELTVSDDGVGMDDATSARIFEPFFTKRPVGEAAGLGLAVVHGIVRTHRGGVTVQSAVGQGATFRVYLPAVAARAKRVKRPRRAENVDGGGKRVLLVDDDPQVATTSERLLERLGFRVTAIRDPHDAFRVLADASCPFDALVTDLTMPAVSGLEVAAEAHRLRPALPVLLTTGDRARLDAARAHEVGVDEVVEKPVTVRSLGEAILRAIARRA